MLTSAENKKLFLLLVPLAHVSLGLCSRPHVRNQQHSAVAATIQTAVVEAWEPNWNSAILLS